MGNRPYQSTPMIENLRGPNPAPYSVHLHIYHLLLEETSRDGKGTRGPGNKR